ncbi:MAG: STAS domain-containing protein [bacterium]
MNLKVDEQGHILLVKILEPRLDAAISLDFKNKMSEYIKNGHKSILINLSEVDFIDSSGLGAMVTSLKLLGEKGGISICGVRETVKSMFKLTRMNFVFNIFENENEALAELSKNN